ncbi:uncharacterized protein LOC131690788 [Topomyia yanbarensis]|uniref:uncharacterized protein LOC131690788 n=1 Tax=Topomyia yanbarensis TaxID=2498891 RepID=UPI00273B742E|nr:uncharacterized protein LOC131690788 [Topomyia yanbarensis]
MDKDTSKNLTFNKTLEEVRMLNTKNEKLLKDFGIDITNLSDSAQAALDDYAKIKQLTGLAELDASFVDGYCYQEQAKRLEARLQSIPLKARIRQLNNEIKREETDLAKLEHFVTETRAQLIPEDEMGKIRIILDKRIEVLRSKQKTLMEKADRVNMDELIAKVNTLEAEKNT